MTNNISQYISTPDNLFALLASYRVVVPGIQRHYVQGANNPRAKSVRESFISSLFYVSQKEEDIFRLHFIYGPIKVEGKDAFTPVDGQQRLTTIWLLARYTAERLDDKIMRRSILNLLSRFSYSERTHAARFCKALTNSQINDAWNIEEDPKESIFRQEWFWDYWKQDETVFSMLEMLSTIHANWNNEFSAEKILEFLTSRVKFELKVDSFADDIYMKMNARGLALTQWENFKGKFAELLSDNSEENYSDYVNNYINIYNNKSDFTVKSIWNRQIEKLSNIFYEMSNDDANNRRLPDNTFFALIGRLTDYINDKKSTSQIQELSSLTRENWSDIDLPYVAFEDFKTVFFYYNDSEKKDIKKQNINVDEFAIICLVLIEKVLLSSKEQSPYWEAQRTLFDSFFYPKNLNECDLSLSCFEYFSKFPNASQKDFFSARRFMWNILENVLRDPKKERNRISIIKECILLNDPSLYPINASELLSENSHEQLREEIEKANKMHNDNNQIPEGWNNTMFGPWVNWSSAIQQAENYAFFHGAIRFLFTVENKDFDWKDFAKKWENVNEYFDDKGVKPDYHVLLTYALIKRLRNWDQLYDKQIFNTNAETWKNMLLCNSKYNAPIHDILNADKNSISSLEMYDDFSGRAEKNVRNEICNLELISILIKQHDEFRLKWNNYIALYRPYRGQGEPITFDWWWYDDNNKECGQSIRLRFLKSVNEINILNPKVSPRLYYGWGLKFQFKGYTFVWQTSNWVDMYDGTEKLYERGQQLINDGKIDQGNKYKQLHSHYGDVEELHEFPDYNFFTDAKSFISELERCIQEYKSFKRT